MKKVNKPTRQETSAAMQAQAPIDKPQALAKMGIFSSLLKQPTVDAAQLLGGGVTEWIDAMRKEPNALFPSIENNFSRPFFVLRAWYFESKTAQTKERMGLKIATPDEKIWHLSLPYRYNEDGTAMFTDREAVLNHFEQSTTPVGLMQFEKVDRGFSNSYWRLIYSDEHSMELAGEAIQVPEKKNDDDATPF